MYTRLISFGILLGRMEAGARTNPVSRREGGREMDSHTIASIRDRMERNEDQRRIRKVSRRKRERRRVNFDVLSDPFEIAVTNPCRRGPRFAYG